MGDTGLRTVYPTWQEQDRRLRAAIAGLSPDQLATCPSAGEWPLWAIVGHLACQRVFWLCDFAGVPRLPSTPFPDAPSNCPGDDDLEHVLGAGELVDALAATFEVVGRALDTWTPASLGDELRRPEWGDDWIHTRGAVLQRVSAHDAWHAADVSRALVAAGLDPVDYWP